MPTHPLPGMPDAQMAESVDALVSNTNAARRAGSIPALGTQKWPADSCRPFYIFVFYALKTLCSHCIITLYEIADALPFTKDKSVVVVLFTKVKPIDDIGNAILPEEVIKLSY